MNKKGLAFVEVVVIVCVLAAIAIFMLHTLNRRKTSGHKYGGCVGNMKQFGLAIAMYTSEMYFNAIPDGDGIPITTDLESVFDLATLWDEGDGLVSDDKVFLCPYARGTVKASMAGGYPGDSDSGFMDNTDKVSYGLTNGFAKHDKPSKIIMADIAGLSELASDNHDERTDFGDQTCLYIDGHVKLQKTATPSGDDPDGIYEGVINAGGADTIIF